MMDISCSTKVHSRVQTSRWAETTGRGISDTSPPSGCGSRWHPLDTREARIRCISHQRQGRLLQQGGPIYCHIRYSPRALAAGQPLAERPRAYGLPSRSRPGGLPTGRVWCLSGGHQRSVAAEAGQEGRGHMRLYSRPRRGGEGRGEARVASATRSGSSVGSGEFSEEQYDSLPEGIIHPSDPRYKMWRVVSTLAAALSAVFIPWQVAFGTSRDLYSFGTRAGWVEAGLLVLFLLDMWISYRLAYEKDEALMFNLQDVHTNYIKNRSWIDLLGLVPLDLVYVTAMGGPAEFTDQSLHLICLLRLLHLVRLYRVKLAFSYLEYNSPVNIVWLTIIRNSLIVAFVVHWAACGFYYVEGLFGFKEEVMVGADGTFFNSLNLVDQYLYSVYWALQTLTTSDYGNPSPMSMQQTFAAGIRSTLFLGFQTALMAYILGTTTLLLVKSDERMGRFRDRFATVRQFADSNRLPKELRERMEEHLRLYFETNDLADAQVLQVYPSTIRRQILRFLYYDTLKQAYLFNGIGRAFLDAVLAEASLEVYLPNVEILTSGEFVNELHLVVQGSVEARQPSTGHSLSTMDEGDEMAFDPDAPNFLTRTLHVGELFGETAFFTETPQLETVRSRTMCRVMVLSRSAFESMERNHPISARRVLYNLQKHAEELVAEAFPEQRKSKTFGRLLKRSPSSLQIGPDALNVSQYTFPTSSGSSSRSYSSGPSAYAENGASASNGRAGGRPYSNGNGNNGSSNGGSTNGATRNNGVDGPSWLTASMNGDVYTLAESISTGLTPEQELVLQTLLRIRAVVQSQISKLDEERTTLFLYAASQGNSSLIRKMVDEGFMVDSVDYDGRTALMLASASGHVAVVKLLLQHGADPNHQDGLGRCAILEACMHDHDAVIDVLRLSGASLQHVAEEGVMLEGKEESLRQEQVLKEVQAAARLCTAVYQCNLPLLRRLMRAGTPVNAGDYDKRTALHISAAEGNLPVVKMLVEEWEADIDVRDRWGNLPLDEANRVGATPVVDFLRSARAKRVAQAIEHIAEQL